MTFLQGTESGVAMAQTPTREPKDTADDRMRSGDSHKSGQTGQKPKIKKPEGIAAPKVLKYPLRPPKVG